MNNNYVPIDELATQVSMTVSTIRQWVHKGYIPSNTYLKVGTTYRFNVPAVLEALQARTEEQQETLEQTDEVTDMRVIATAVSDESLSDLMYEATTTTPNKDANDE